MNWQLAADDFVEIGFADDFDPLSLSVRQLAAGAIANDDIVGFLADGGGGLAAAGLLGPASSAGCGGELDAPLWQAARAASARARTVRRMAPTLARTAGASSTASCG